MVAVPVGVPEFAGTAPAAGAGEDGVGGYKASSTQTFKEQAGASMMEFYTLEKTVYLNPVL
jgi:hypothetical protein